jgi:hypothetical protein
MVGPRRFELPTSRLSVVRSSQLSYGPIWKLERVMGIEPTLSAWEADVLPLNYTRIMAELTGFEPAVSCVTGRHVRPLHHSSMLVAGAGLEPAAFGL